MEFASDNVFGVHRSILALLGEASAGASPSYGYDSWTRAAEEAVAKVFETDVRLFLVATGTAANALALSSICPAHGAILCHAEAHINTDECGAPELFTGGAKLHGLAGYGCKLKPETVQMTLEGFVRGEHESKPSALSITQATELGTIYTPGEITELSKICKAHALKLHMDGSRFANALVHLDCSPAEVTWKAGVDVMSFGGTKNGALALEAVIFFTAGLAEDFIYRRKRAGQLLSKGRFLGAQMVAYLTKDLWLHNARHANAMASLLAQRLSENTGVRLPLQPQANEVFAIMPQTLYAALCNSGVQSHEWLSDSLGNAGPKQHECLARFVTSFATQEESINALGELLKRLAK